MASRRKPVGLVETVATGDLRASLEALRDHLAAEICRSNGVAVASLARQLADVCKTLGSMPAVERSRLDELADRRTARRAGSQVPERASRAVKRGG